MADAHPCFRNKHRNLCGHLLNALHAVVQIINLAATGQLTFHRLTGKRLAVLNHIRLYGKAVLWWSLDD
ncbi:hypothetical protein D3C80_1918410 [compost metagenome]